MDSVTSKDEGAPIDKLPIFSVDSFANGIAFGQSKSKPDEDPRDQFALRLCDELEVAPLRSRYTLGEGNCPLKQLESHLMRLSRQGILSRSTIFFGTFTDPFHPFDGKFDASMRFLDLFQRYTPGLLVVQTRSPLLTIALPVLKRLGKHVSVTIGIETHKEDMVARYTPGLPRVEERLKTMKALQRFGIEVCAQVSPVLPYGDWKKDAGEFAEILIEHSTYIHAQPFLAGDPQKERKLKNHAVIVRLAEDRRFHWLRHDAANPLISAIEQRVPEKLKVPMRTHLADRQLGIFAA